MFARPILAALMMSALALPAFAQDADTVVAKVNGTEITLGQMAAMKLGLPPDMAGMPPQELWDLMLDQMIRQAAMAEVGEATATPRDKAALVIDRRAYLAGAALERLAEFEPTDAEIQAAYEKAFPADKPVTEYDADHILLETEEAAKAVIDELAKGGDFAKLAEERSVDTGSGLNGGDLGWFTQDQFGPEFGVQVAALQDGQVSAPFKTQAGWHIVQREGTRQVDAADENRRAQVREAIGQRKLEESWSRYLQQLRGEAYVDIHPADGGATSPNGG